MTETQNVATYARIRPYNPAINEDKKLTARCKDGNQILNQNGANEDSYNFTKVFDMTDDTNTLFNEGIKPLLDFKILQGINSIFIVYGQSGSGKSFTLIGEEGHLGVLPMSLKYLLNKEVVEHIKIASVECYGIKAAKIGFYDLVSQLKKSQQQQAQASKGKLKVGHNDHFDPYKSPDNPRLTSSNAETIDITQDNCLQVIRDLQNVSHMAPTLKNPHSSRGHTVYFVAVKMVDFEPVYFIAVDLAGSEGQTALGTKDEFIAGLKLAISKGKLKLSKKQISSFEEMYKIRSLEAGCINNGLTQLQSIFGELIKKKISKSQGLGLRKVLSSFISLNSAYSILFTLSASANNNKVTRATLNFAKQTQLVKVDTKKAKKKIDKDKIIRELNQLIEQLRTEMKEKNHAIKEFEIKIKEKDAELKTKLESAIANTGGDDNDDDKSNDDNKSNNENKSNENENEKDNENSKHDIENDNENDDNDKDNEKENSSSESSEDVFTKFDKLNQQLLDAQEEEDRWNVRMDSIHMPQMSQTQISEDEMLKVFTKFDSDGSGSIDADELNEALISMGQTLTSEQLQDLVEEIDVNGDGEIDFDEFKVLFSQSWFINMHQHKLAESIESMITNMTTLGSMVDLGIVSEFDEDDDDYGDAKDDFFYSDQEAPTPTPTTPNTNANIRFKDRKRTKEQEKERQEREKEKDELIESLQAQMEQLKTEYENKMKEVETEYQDKINEFETTTAAERIVVNDSDNTNGNINKVNYKRRVGEAMFFILLGATIAYVVPKYIGKEAYKKKLPQIVYRIWDQQNYS